MIRKIEIICIRELLLIITDETETELLASEIQIKKVKCLQESKCDIIVLQLKMSKHLSSKSEWITLQIPEWTHSMHLILETFQILNSCCKESQDQTKDYLLPWLSKQTIHNQSLKLLSPNQSWNRIFFLILKIVQTKYKLSATGYQMHISNYLLRLMRWRYRDQVNL